MAYKFQVGDVIVGNDLANSHYCFTQKGWIGQVTSVDRDYFAAKTLYKNGKYGTVFPGLDYDCFDLLEHGLDAKQVEQMKTML